VLSLTSEALDRDNIWRLTGPRRLLTQDFLDLGLGLFLLRSKVID